MRPTFAILIAAGLIGCAAKPHYPQLTVTQTPNFDQPQYEPRVSTALVFDPPIAKYDEPVVLARSDREPLAVVGYDQTTTTVFNTYYNDTQYGPSSLPSLWFQ